MMRGEILSYTLIHLLQANGYRPNNSMNPTAGGRHLPRSRVGRSPAAGYAER